MLKNLLNLSNVQPLKKAEQSSINGGASRNCFLDCRRDYITCLTTGGSNCLASYNACKTAC
ncbi:hypothetical protein [Aquimarina sp. I32.4]|uniref:hypothetical protein n=1 Tax=Aquimarina sp. I32.4 TaxID=2053903 RepID=UPI000CDEA534|nr:hypothetical protein [Aquimarina sp. I32.4]